MTVNLFYCAWNISFFSVFHIFHSDDETCSNPAADLIGVPSVKWADGVPLRFKSALAVERWPFPPKNRIFFVRVQWFNQEKKNSIPTNEVTNCSPELIYESALQSMRPDERCAGHFKLAHFINHLWPSRFISGAVCAEQMVVRILWRPIFWYGARNGKLANKFSINLIFY